MSINEDKEDLKVAKKEKEEIIHGERDENLKILNLDEKKNIDESHIPSELNSGINTSSEEKSVDKPQENREDYIDNDYSNYNSFDEEANENKILTNVEKFEKPNEEKLKNLAEKFNDYKTKYQKLEDIAQKYETRNHKLLEKRKEYEEKIKTLEKRNQELIDSKEEFAKRSEQLQEGRKHFLELSKELERKKAEIEQLEKKLQKEQKFLEKSKFEIEKSRIAFEKEKLEFDIGKSELKENSNIDYSKTSRETTISKREEKELTGKAKILEDILEKFYNEGQFQSCFLIDGKGMLVSEYGKVNLDTIAIGAMFSLITTNALRTVISLSLQGLDYFKLSSINGDFIAKEINLNNYARSFILLAVYNKKSLPNSKNNHKIRKKTINKIFKNIKTDFYEYGYDSKLNRVFDNFNEKLSLLKQKYSLPETDIEMKRLRLLNKISIEIKELFESE
ncbi:MAG: hypothetical protein ACFFAV_17020 [Candidatus Hermodarchaeota archaeon]